MTTRRSRLVLVLVALAALTLTPALAQQDLWLHVRVDDRDGGENVKVNIPLALVATVLPQIEASPHLKGGKVQITERLGTEEIDLRALWAEVSKAADGEYVTVTSPTENVKVRKSQGFFLVDVDAKSDEGQGNEKVRVRMPLKVLDALFSAGEDQIDIIAAINALSGFEGEDLVSVEEENSTVRIWVDRNQSAP